MRDITVAHVGYAKPSLGPAQASLGPALESIDRTLGRRTTTASRFGRTLSRLSDDALLRRLVRLVARERVTTAMLLVHIAEVDARRLYAPAGYSSMHEYCVEELRLSEDAASKRIQVARTARRVPALLEALAQGRLHLSGARLLAPHITGENATELIEAATHRTRVEIEEMLVRRFSLSWDLRPVPAEIADGSTEGDEHAPGHVGRGDPSTSVNGSEAGRPGGDDNGLGDEHAPGHVAAIGPVTATPSVERVSLCVAISRNTQEKLRYAQALLSHAVPSGDPGQVLDRALDALIEKVEKRRFGAGAARRLQAGGGGSRRSGTGTRRVGEVPRHGKKPTAAAPNRYVPAAVRRAVWERDGGRCTFVGANGHRCETRRFLEFDHREPAALGGKATVQGLRLRCRTHNQYEAERVYGAGFMENRRREAREARGRTARTPASERVRDIQAGLRGLGCRADAARRAAERAAAELPRATLEEQLRKALQSIR